MEKLNETKRERVRVFRNRKVSLWSQSKRHIPRIIPFRNKPSTKRQLPDLKAPRARKRERDEGEGEEKERNAEH